MSRFHNNGKGVWISPRPDTFPNGTSRRQFPTGRRDGGGFARPSVDDSELDSRLPEGSQHDDVLNNKLDRLLDRFDKLDVWREDTDRKFENLEPTLVREMESPSRIDDGEDWEYEDARRRRSGDWGLRGRNPSGGFREGPQEDRYSRWKIHPTTETGRERVNPPRSPYAYNAGHEPARQPSCWEPPPYQPDRNPYVSRQPWREPQLPSFADGPDPRRIHTEYQQWQPNYHPPGVLDTQSTDQPPQFVRTLSHRKAPLPAVAPPRSGSKHLPYQSREFIGSGQQCGRPNSPHLKVRSPCPAQLAAVSDYNEKLRIYRLEQAALVAELNAWFEENIDDENLVEDVPNNAAHNGGSNLDVDTPINESREEIVKTDNRPLQVLVGVCDENIHDENQAEEKTDDNPMIVLGDDTPNDITNVPNDGASLDVPNNESLEEFVKNENESRQVLVEAYDDKVGDLIVPKLEIKDDVETLLEENVVCYEDIIILIESPANRNIGAIKINSNISRSHIMFKCILESWCGLSIQSLIHYPQQPCTFDPGGKLMLSTLHQFIVPTLRTRWISTVGELIRDIFTFI